MTPVSSKVFKKNNHFKVSEKISPKVIHTRGNCSAKKKKVNYSEIH